MTSSRRRPREEDGGGGPQAGPLRGPERPVGEPVYTISVVARLCRLPVHRIRWLETHELVEPSRTGGNQRLFSDEDVELLREIAELLERRVNLAGVRLILRMKRTYRLGPLELREPEEDEG